MASKVNTVCTVCKIGNKWYIDAVTVIAVSTEKNGAVLSVRYGTVGTPSTVQSVRSLQSVHSVWYSR